MLPCVQAFFDEASGVYLASPTQTHQAMSLAGGVVPSGAPFARAMSALEHEIAVTHSGHLDVGLTGNYFLTKLLTDQGRNDLVFAMTNQTTFPSYGYFLEQGFTTWPESWAAQHGVSKMHGCYNAIGLWFLQGVAGITVDAAAAEPGRRVVVRAGVDAGDVTHASGSRFALRGRAVSSWALVAPAAVAADGGSGAPPTFVHNITIPTAAGFRADASSGAPAAAAAVVLIPCADTASGADVTEGGQPVAGGAVVGVAVLGVERVNGIPYLALSVAAGSYRFASGWVPAPAVAPA
jgi:alpha-L-rhamnosidase